MNRAMELLELLRVGRLRIGLSPRCSDCGTPNYCRHHQYAYVRWLKGTKPFLEILSSQR